MKMKNEKGVFLVSSVLVLSVVGTLSVALYLKNIALYSAAERTVNRITAFHQAESGLDDAIAKLRADLSYGGQGYTALGEKGGYDTVVEIPDPIGKPTLRRITAIGHVPNNIVSAHAYASRQVIAYVDFLPPSLFNYALFADATIALRESVIVDSYDSRMGPYNPQTPGSKGHIGINGIFPSGGIFLENQVLVKGDAVAGPGADVSTTITTTGGAVITGSRRAASEAQALPDVKPPPGTPQLGALSVGQGTVTLSGGTYWYSSIDITGNGKVNLTGPATIYVDGKVRISGQGFKTKGQSPPNLLIHVLGRSSASVEVDFYGGFYAPRSMVTVGAINGTSHVYGALIGKYIIGGGGESFPSQNVSIHYDEAMKTASVDTEGGTTPLLLAWTET